MDKIQHQIRLLELNAADWLFLFSGVGVVGLFTAIFVL
jgi:hypothetical protein